MAKNNKWSLDKVRIYISDQNGNEKILTSNDLTDYSYSEIIDDVENYVRNLGGELE